MKTPVLLIAFNRFDTLRTVFDRVRQAKPPILFIAVDGPRDGNESDRISTEQVKGISKMVDWDCFVYTRYLERNLGCGYAPSTAISWAFEHCDRLIVLEDDCLPCYSFFTFCDEMLELYAADNRIGMISGWSPLQDSDFFHGYDYLFSLLGNSLGWATWKNRWLQFDMEMSDFNRFYAEGKSYDIIGSKILGRHYNYHFKKRFLNIEEEKKHSWDTQWFYARYKNSYLSIIPVYNQIKYIGFDSGTHVPASASYLMIPSHELPSEIKHPCFVSPNRRYTSSLFWKIQKRRYGIKNILGYLQTFFKRKCKGL